MKRFSFAKVFKQLRECAGFLGRGAFSVIATVVLALALPGHALAAGDTRGRDFWVMFNANNDTPALTLFIAGESATTGVVSIPGLSFTANFAVTPGAVTSIPLPAGAQVTALNTVQNLGVRITAGADVTVYGLNRLINTTDAFVAIPIAGLGTSYLALGYGAQNGSQVGIVATAAATSVTITPTALEGGHAAGVPYTVTLGAGQTYMLQTVSGDLTGSSITSTQPIAVFAGNKCAQVPTGVAACDHLVEQMPPTDTWGKSFVTVPLATRLLGDTFRVLASTDGTVVSINGAAVASLNRGRFYETILTAASTITATQPVLVAQYSNGSLFDGVTSDPFEMLIPPYEQFLAAYTVTTPASGFARNYINLVVPTAAVGAIRLDGAVIPASAFTAIGTSGFSGAQRPVALGSHTLSGPLPFGVFVYGFDNFDSYGYPGGYLLSPLILVNNIELLPRTGSGVVGVQHCLTAAPKTIAGVAVPGVRVDFNVTGANPSASFANANPLGIAQYCYTGTNAGSDTIVASVGTVTATATKTWVRMCDADGNGRIDIDDIALIDSQRNTLALTADPRDPNRDGRINILDSRQCTLQCTRAQCAR